MSSFGGRIVAENQAKGMGWAESNVYVLKERENWDTKNWGQVMWRHKRTLSVGNQGIPDYRWEERDMEKAPEGRNPAGTSISNLQTS